MLTGQEAADGLTAAPTERPRRRAGRGARVPTPPAGAAHPPPVPAVLCFALTRSLLLTCLVPAGLLGLRYYYSRKVVLAYLDCALHTDMADIEQYYMKPPGESAAPAPLLPQPLLRPGRAWAGTLSLLSD